MKSNCGSINNVRLSLHPCKSNINKSSAAKIATYAHETLDRVRLGIVDAPPPTLMVSYLTASRPDSRPFPQQSHNSSTQEDAHHHERQALPVVGKFGVEQEISRQ